MLASQGRQKAGPRRLRRIVGGDRPECRLLHGVRVVVPDPCHDRDDVDPARRNVERRKVHAPPPVLAGRPLQQPGRRAALLACYPTPSQRISRTSAAVSKIPARTVPSRVSCGRFTAAGREGRPPSPPPFPPTPV